PEVCSASVRKNCPTAASENCGDPSVRKVESAVPDRIDPTVEWEQSATVDAGLNQPSAQAHGQQLTPGHVPVPSFCQFVDPTSRFIGRRQSLRLSLDHM